MSGVRTFIFGRPRPLPGDRRASRTYTLIWEEPPYRPQTNGKIERFHRTLADGWAYARFYGSEAERRMALPGWLHFYNHHRHHSAIGAPPISRIQNNLPRQHN